MKSQVAKGHENCLKEGKDVVHSKAYIELQRKVSNLEAINKKQAQQIKNLQQKLASDDKQGSCCCDELRLLHQEKEKNLVKISDAWKQKTYTLVNKYSKNVQSVRQENM